MSRLMITLACGASLLSQAAGQEAQNPQAAGQEPPKPRRRDATQIEGEYRQQLLRRAEEEYRQTYKKPETAAEYWAAIKYEIDVGRFALAGQLVKGLLDATAEEKAKDLLALEEQDGLSAFLRLRLVTNWVDDPNLPKPIADKINRETNANVEQLIARVTQVLQKHLANTDRIQRLIKLLGESEEDRRFAVNELNRSGAIAVPTIIETLRQTPVSDDMHQVLLDTLAQLGKDAVPALVAALDMRDPLRVELIGVLEKRAEAAAVPELWHLSASDSPDVRQKATEALQDFLRVGPGQLPPAKQALTREAERYYEHRVNFPVGQPVVVWQWESNQLRPQSVTPTQAEEFYALRYARQALEIDPAYEPAQVIFLSTALEKGFERGGIDQPLAKSAPAVKELIDGVNPALVMAVLQRGLNEHRLPVILGSVRALGDMGELRAARPTANGPAVLVKALNYPDRRVQLAAADSLLRMPGRPEHGANSRVVDVLRRVIVGSPTTTIVIADPNVDRGEDVAHAVKEAGFNAIRVRSGREVLSRLNEAADVDLLLVDASVPYPELPFLLGQLRADVTSGLLPVIVTVPPRALDAPPSRADRSLALLIEHYPNTWIMPTTLSSKSLKSELTARMDEAGSKALSAAERRADALLAMRWLARMATGESPGYDIRPAQRELLEATRSDDLAALAIRAVSRLPGREVQRQLAAIIANNGRPLDIRTLAAAELHRNLRQYGVSLSADQARSLDELFASVANDPKQKPLAEALALVVGSIHPSVAQTGARLQRYAPPLGSPAPAPEPASAPDKEK